MTTRLRITSAGITALFAMAGLSACAIEGRYFESSSEGGVRCTDSAECGAGLHCAMEGDAGMCREPSRAAADASVGTKVSGAACTGASDCASGLECVSVQGAGVCRERASVSNAATTVTSACVRNAECSTGQVCQIANGSGVCRVPSVLP